MAKWTDPRVWVSGEKTLSSDFNTYIRDNLLFLKNKNLYQKRIGFQAANQTVVAADGWQPVFPDTYFIDFTCFGGDIDINAYFHTTHNTNNLYINHDLHLQPLDGSTGYFLSSKTTTPTAYGVYREGRTAAYTVTRALHYFIPRLKARQYKLTFWFSVDSGTGTFNATNVDNWITVEERSVADYDDFNTLF